jgi:hypothetical protein
VVRCVPTDGGPCYEPRRAESAIYDRIYEHVDLELYERLAGLFPALDQTEPQADRKDGVSR